MLAERAFVSIAPRIYKARIVGTCGNAGLASNTPASSDLNYPVSRLEGRAGGAAAYTRWFFTVVAKLRPEFHSEIRELP